MKKLLNIKIALVCLMATALFSSCLKDKAREYHFEDNAPVIDFALTAFKISSAQSATISATANSQVNALITVQSANPTTTAIAATVVVDPTKLTSAQTLLPASMYTIVAPGLSITIPPGTSQPVVGNGTVPVVGAVPSILAQGQGVVSFTINGPAFKALQVANPTVIYALPLVITSASGQGVIIDQFNTLVYRIVVP